MLHFSRISARDYDPGARERALAVSVLRLAATALAGALLVVGCGETLSAPPLEVPVDTVMLNRTSAFITIAGRVQLTATPQSVSGHDVSDAAVTWRSEGAAATVSAEGLVTGVAAGTANIVATSRGRSSTATITVIEAAPGDTILVPSPATLARGQSHTLRFLAFDGNGLATNVQTNVEGSWTTSDASVATVASDGKVTAVAAGTASIAVTLAGKTRSAAVSVVQFSAIAPASGAVCAIATTGALYCSGRGYGPKAQRVAPGLRFRSVTGYDNLCALSVEDLAYCWWPTRDLRTQPAQDPTFEPTLVSANLSFQTVSAGEPFMNCGLTAAGEGYCWGTPHITNGFRASTAPVRLAITDPLSQIQPGCALTTGGKVYCWGSPGAVGALGTGVAGGDEEWSPPVPVNSNVQFTAVCWGACALGPVGDPYQWGYVGQGLGADTCRGRVNACNFSPALVPTSLRFTHVTGASRGRCGLTEAGQVACWGINDYDVLGIASSETPPCPGAGQGTGTPPCIAEPMVTLTDFRSIAGGLTNLCGIGRTGFAVCWGSNAYGQLTDPNTVASTPKPKLFSIDPAR